MTLTGNKARHAGRCAMLALLFLTAGMHEVPGAAQDSPTVADAERVTLSGKVSVVGGKVDPATLDVRVNGVVARIGADGVIAGGVPVADHYRLTVSGPGVFPSVHAFAHDELAGRGGQLGLPAVEVVARAPGRVEMFFGGDTMLGRRYVEPIWGERVLISDATRMSDMAALLEPMRPYFSGSDLASLNLETVLATKAADDAPDKLVVFHTHSDAARALADAGIDYVSLGNNHVYDYLEPGLRSTTDALDAARIAWSGAGANETEALRAARMVLGGQRYAMLGYVGWKGRVEPNQIAEKDKGGAAFGSDENIRDTVRREVAAGNAPIVQYHGSTEYSDRPTNVSERRMKLAIDEGAALVVSHHPHVPQGFELYKGRLIAYSLGNYLFDQYFPETHASVALKVWMDGDALFRAEVVPIQILDYRPVPAAGEFRQSILRRIVALSAERGTAIRIAGGHGVISPDATAANAARACPSPYAAGIVSLRFDLHQPGAQACGDVDARRRGTDLLVRGDFETARHADAVDRSWEATGATIGFGGPGRQSRNAMILTAEGAPTMTIAPRTFYRPTDARSYSLTGWIRADGPLQLEALVQPHPPRTNRFTALESAPSRRVGQAAIAGTGWQPFRFDFNVDVEASGRTLPIRPVLRIIGVDEARIDDATFIAWEAGESRTARPALHSHLDVDTP